MFVLLLQRLALEAMIDVLFFPLWWYSTGLKRAARSAAMLVKSGSDFFAPGLWLQNLFVPMFGQTDWQGRIMSVFMRIINIIARGFAMIVWTIICLALFLLWIVWPLFVLYMLLRSLLPIL